MPMTRTEVRLSKVVVVDDQPQQFLQFAEVTADATPRALSLIIGATEALEISRAVRKEETPRPMTHELMHQLIDVLGGSIQELEIHHLHQGTYHAALRLGHADGTVRVDCRPSDGVALALRAGAKIFVTENVWDQIQADPSQE